MSTGSGTDATQLMARLADTLGNGFAALAIAVGVDLGLFEKMAKYDSPQTSTQIAADTGCKERYIREWLNLLVTSDWLMYDEENSGYFMSPAQKETLTSPFSFFIPIIQHASHLYGQLLDCFKEAGPNGFDPQGLFNGRLADVAVRRDSIEFVGELMDVIPEMTSKFENNSKVCEIGCGAGSQLHSVAKKYPTSRFVGCDFSEKAIERAMNGFMDPDLSNLSYELQDASKLPSDWTESFDVVLVRDVIHDLPNALDVLKEILRILKKEGIFVMVDIFSHDTIKENKALPNAKVLYGCSLFNCLPSSMNAENPAGLGAMWGAKKAEQLLKTAGFSVDPYTFYSGFMIFVSHKV